MDPGHLHTDSDPKAYSADREEEPVDPGSQPDDTTEESENYPQKLFPVEEASQCTENGKPVHECTEETLEPRLVVYGTRSAWSTGNGHSQSHAEGQVDEGIDQPAESLFFLTLLLFILLRN